MSGSAPVALPIIVGELVSSRRVVRVRIAGETRYVPVEYASRYRDALGTPLPPGLAEVFLAKSEDPLREILRRYARTHGPFTTADLAARYRLSSSALDVALHALHGLGKLLEGGKLRTNVGSTVPLSKAAQAQELIEQHKTKRGKVVLKVA